MLVVEKYPNEYVVVPALTKGGIQVIHLPSGLHTECSVYSSPHKNKIEAIKAIQEKLLTIKT